MNKHHPFSLIIVLLLANSCKQDSETDIECISDQELDTSRGTCEENLNENPSFEMIISGSTRIITSNSIPDHHVGLFGNKAGALNPNAISAQSETYSISTNPTIASALTPLLSTTGNGPDAGP